MKLTDLMRKKESFLFHDGALDEEIEKAEKELEVHFAEDYKEYLKEYGEASFAGHEFTGIYGQDRLDVVKVTLEERQRYSIDMSDAYVIESLNINDLVIWQNTEGEVFISQPTITKQRIFSSLREYIESI